MCLISPGDQFVFSALRGTILCQHSKPVFKRVEATEKAFITSLSQRPSCPTSAEQQSCWDMEHFIRWQKLKSLWWQKSAFFLHKLINYKCAPNFNINTYHPLDQKSHSLLEERIHMLLKIAVIFLLQYENLILKLKMFTKQNRNDRFLDVTKYSDEHWFSLNTKQLEVGKGPIFYSFMMFPVKHFLDSILNNLGYNFPFSTYPFIHQGYVKSTTSDPWAIIIIHFFRKQKVNELPV